MVTAHSDSLSFGHLASTVTWKSLTLSVQGLDTQPLSHLKAFKNEILLNQSLIVSNKLGT